ncbi:hypothetical protein [Streptomyces canus]|uniref:hypothetical protein n=1 Tax=Streptomyces canus TaxID=58343 RepID=UPI002E317AB6|nr:hypothetical protein [Streptomyces canus]
MIGHEPEPPGPPGQIKNPHEPLVPLPAPLPNLTIDELGDPTNLMISGPGAPPSRSRVTAPA